MKKTLYIGLLLFVPMLLMAQGHGLQVSAKGGTCTWLGSPVQNTMGGLGGLELAYSVRWRLDMQTQLGMKIGAGFTYSGNQLSANLSEQFDRTDPVYHLPIHYTATSSVREMHRQIGIEAPIMLAWQIHGFSLNIGPKLRYVLQDTYNQIVGPAHIVANVAGVTIVDDPATGRLETPYQRDGQSPALDISALLSAEIGYEWQVGNCYSRRNEQYVGVQLYMDYGVWSLRSANNTNFLSVTLPSQSGSNAQVHVGTLYGSNALNYFSAGLRLYYTIQSIDYPGRGWHASPRHRHKQK